MPNSEKNLMPSDQQIREFWKWYGWKYVAKQGEPVFGPSQGHDYWYYHNHWVDSKDKPHSRLPRPDLNNLFKYGVPKLTAVGLRISLRVNDKGKGESWAEIFNDKLSHTAYVNAWHIDPALALFWAVWEVIHAK